MFCARQQSSFALGQFGGEELDGSKLVRVREFVESGQQLGQFHENNVSVRETVANQVLPASNFWLFPTISPIRRSFSKMPVAIWAVGRWGR